MAAAAAAAAAAASALAVAPMNYWAGQGISHLSSDYSYNKMTPLLNGFQTESYSGEVSPPTGESSSQTRTHVYLPAAGVTAPEELMQQCVLPELGSNTLLEFDSRAGTAQQQHQQQGMGLYHTPTSVPHHKQSSVTNETNSAAAVPNGSSKPLTKRYSQKPHHTINRSSVNASGPTRGSGSGAGRSTVVTVRVGSSVDPRSPSPPETSETLTESDAGNFPSFQSANGKKSNPPSNSGSQPTNASADSEALSNFHDDRSIASGLTRNHVSSQPVVESKPPKSPPGESDADAQEGHDTAGRQDALVVVT